MLVRASVLDKGVVPVSAAAFVDFQNLHRLLVWHLPLRVLQNFFVACYVRSVSI